LFLFSSFWCLSIERYSPRTAGEFTLARGQVFAEWSPGLSSWTPSTSWHLYELDYPDQPFPWRDAWSGELETASGPEIHLRVPLWLTTFVSAVGSGGAWWVRLRRARTGCKRCGYDLSGLPPGSSCPECAAEPPEH
jgi:hypothetical protein